VPPVPALCENGASEKWNAISNTEGVGTSAAAAEVAGVRITHPERVMYAEPRLTKVDVARYYAAVAEWMVRHVEGRPLTLVACPGGVEEGCFYMRHSNVRAPKALRRIPIREKTKAGEYLIADSARSLVLLAQMNVLEIHTWNSRADHLEQPDRLVFDIDPGPDVPWAAVADAARQVRRTLRALELESFLKTTGGRGLHLVVPLAPKEDWSVCLAFARAVAETIEREDPERYTTRFAKAGREGKILIDYLRNNRTNTSVAAFSTRARPGAPVSLPISWQELGPRLDPARFTIRSVPARLARQKQDPWAGYWSPRQRITAAMKRAVRAA